MSEDESQRGISREEFDAWQAKFKRLAPNCIGSDAQVNEYFESLQDMPTPSLRNALQRKLDLETRGSDLFNERAARPGTDYGMPRAEFDEFVESMRAMGHPVPEDLFAYLRCLPIGQARDNLAARLSHASKATS